METQKEMKNILSSVALVLLLATGCARELTPKEVAYETLGGTRMAVESAVYTAAIMHAADEITDAELNEVRKIYDVEFVPQFQTAVDLAQMDFNQPTPKVVSDIAKRILVAVGEYKQRKANQ